MKNQFQNLLIFFILIVLASCGQEEKIINHFADCAKKQEICETGCELTETEESELEDCYNMCFFNWQENGFSSLLACIEYCQNQPFGPVAVAVCKKECKESFYECGFGPEWRDLNIVEPEVE